MSTIDEIEVLTFTRLGAVDMRAAIVRTLRILHALPDDPNVYISVDRIRMEDGSEWSTVIVFPSTVNPWAGESWDATDPWLAEVIKAAAEGDAVRSWTWGNVTGPGHQMCAGYSADGSHEETGLAQGMPVHVTLPPYATAFYLATCNLIWGPTWSLRP